MILATWLVIMHLLLASLQLVSVHSAWSLSGANKHELHTRQKFASEFGLNTPLVIRQMQRYKILFCLFVGLLKS